MGGNFRVLAKILPLLALTPTMTTTLWMCGMASMQGRSTCTWPRLSYIATRQKASSVVSFQIPFLHHIKVSSFSTAESNRRGTVDSPGRDPAVHVGVVGYLRQERSRTAATGMSSR